MKWRILFIDDDGRKYTSSALANEAEARSFAEALVKDGKLAVLRIENEAGQTLPFGPATKVVEMMDAAIEEHERKA